MKRLLCLVAFLAPACGGNGGSAPTPAPVPSPTPANVLEQRPYTPLVPSSYSQGTPAPLLIVFHGYGSNGSQMESYFGLSAIADREGFLSIYPEGRPTPAATSTDRTWTTSPM